MRYRRIVAAVAVAFLVMGAAAECDQKPGKVTGRDSDCTGGERPLCTYQLKTSKGWFEVVKDTWRECEVDEKYPQCGDHNNIDKWVPADE